MKLLKIFVLTGLVALISACGGDYPGFDRTDSGLYYQFHVENDKAPKPQIGDVLNVTIVYRLGDSVLFDSRENYDGPFRFPLDPPGFDGDIFEGLAMMHSGDSATFIVPADSLKHFGDLPKLDSGTMLYFDVKLINFQTAAEFKKEQEKLEAEMARELERMKQEEGVIFQNYLTENRITTKPTASGLIIIPSKRGSGPVAKDGKVVEVHYSAFFLSGEKLFNSRDESGSSINFIMGKGFEIPAIEEALRTMNPGSVVKLVIPSALAYGENGIPGLVPPYTPLVFDLELLSLTDTMAFQQKMLQKEKDAIADYVMKNGIKVPPKEGGLYYVEQRKGNGPLAMIGKTVRATYTGKFLNGVVFETSEEVGPIEFVVGDEEIIPGLNMGISYMRAGGKALLIIPSAFAYGKEYYNTIPPYTPLVFEVELLSVK